MTWLLLLDPPAEPAWNMAVDQALLEAAEGDGLRALRLYAWSPAALSFGRHEPATTRYDRARISALGLATVRRPTGGRAVWHGREVTYAVTGPVADFGDLRATYGAIHLLLAEALCSLGAAVTLAPDRAAVAVGAGACFASPAGGEVIAPDGRKVIGSAQVRTGGAFLQHGSIRLAADQHTVAAVTAGPAAAPADAGLDELAGAARATPGAVTEAVAAAAARRWRVPVRPASLPEPVRRRAEALRWRFADEAWTWRR